MSGYITIFSLKGHKRATDLRNLLLQNSLNATSSFSKLTSISLLLISFSLLLSACVGQEESDSDGGVTQQSQSPGTVLRTANFDSSDACPQGGIRIEIGIDTNGNDELDDGEVQQEQELCNGFNGQDGADGQDGTDGVDGEDGADGQDGADGSNGLNSLVSLTDEEAGGGNCAFGGIKIETGLDSNLNGELELGEVNNSQTTFVCNGADGQDSEDAGLNSLVETSVEPPGAQCADGGIRINSGTDENSNGTLEVSEQNATAYVCNVAGVQGTASLLELTAEPPGAHCAYGGTRIDSGLDQNENGNLDNGEIAYTRYVCEQQACSWADNGDGTSTVSCDGETDIVLLNPEALEYTGRTTCVVSISNPDGVGSPIPMIYSVDDIGEDLKFVTLTILDGERQNSNSRLLTSTNPEYEYSVINLYFDNLGTATGGRYVALLSKPANVVEFSYIDSDLEMPPENRYTQAFQAFDDESDESEGLCNRVQVE